MLVGYRRSGQEYGHVKCTVPVFFLSFFFFFYVLIFNGMGNEEKNGRKFVDRNPLVDARFSLSRGSQDS